MGRCLPSRLPGRPPSQPPAVWPPRLPPPSIGHPPATWQTIGASFAMKKVEANGRTCNLGIWDTAGQERLDNSRPRSTLLRLHSLYYGSTTIAARALLYYGSTHSTMAPRTGAPRTGAPRSSSPWLYSTMARLTSATRCSFNRSFEMKMNISNYRHINMFNNFF